MPHSPDRSASAACRGSSANGGGLTSHIHVDDAAAATAISGRGAGSQVCTTSSTTTPPPSRESLPVLADALGAKPPRHIPRWLARLLAGEMATAMMTEAKGSSNLKAKREPSAGRRGTRAGARASRRDCGCVGEACMESRRSSVANNASLHIS